MGAFILIPTYTSTNVYSDCRMQYIRLCFCVKHLNVGLSYVASFPGLPRFFYSSVSVDNNTRMRKGFSPPFRIRVSLSTETEEQKKRGRPGNEARFV